MKHKGEKGDKSLKAEVMSGLRLWAPGAQSHWNLPGKQRTYFEITTLKDGVGGGDGGGGGHLFPSSHLPWVEVYSGSVKPTHTHFYIFRLNLPPVCHLTPFLLLAMKHREQELEVGSCV